MDNYTYQHCLKSNLAEAVYEANECLTNPNGYACDLDKFFKANEDCCRAYVKDDFETMYLQQCLRDKYFEK